MVQVTVVPAFTVNSCGPNMKFPILTAASAAQTGVAARSRNAATPAKTTFISDFLFDMFETQPCSGVSMMARSCFAFTETRLMLTKIYSRAKNISKMFTDAAPNCEHAVVLFDTNSVSVVFSANYGTR